MIKDLCRDYQGTMYAVILGLVFCPTTQAGPTPFVLQNKALAVRFEDSPAGPRLASIDYQPTKDSYVFSDSQEISLAVVRPQAIHDPQAKVDYELQSDFRFSDAAAAKDKRSVIFYFLHDLVRAQVHYELDADKPVLHKTISCSAREGGAYVAGVRQWMLKSAGMELAWPAKSGTFGQPAVLLKPASGCLMTLEWPRQQVLSDEGGIHIEYRPGFNLTGGEPLEVSRGSIVFFGKQANEKNTTLETARRAFFAHVANRAKPNVPFPIKFTTWGPWLTNTTADRILQVVDDLQYVGTDLLHFDAGWLSPDRPYSTRLPKLMEAKDEVWDKALTDPTRLPNGMLPIVKAAKERNMKLSIWMDSLCSRYTREAEAWAILNQEGKPYYAKMVPQLPDAPIQALTSEYGERLTAFVNQAMDRYDLGGILFDFHRYQPDYSTSHDSLANGWDSIDKQLRKMIEIFDECEKRRPGIYRFYCNASPWPWMLLHATHIHAKDPGTTPDMALAIKTDHPARALAFERRLAWQDHYDNFVPPWGIKGDIAGWSMQQKSAIPVNLKHTGLLIPSGEGWTQNMFTCFATTAVRDIRFSFAQVPQFDKDVLKGWLAWDRQRTRYIFNCRPLFTPNRTPNEGIMGYSHVGSGEGVIYLFNSSFDLANAEVLLDEGAGFNPTDKNLSAYMVYPMKAPLGVGKISYGDTLSVPIIGKDCVVIEVGLEIPKNLESYAKYEQVSRSIRRSFKPLYLTPPEEIFNASGSGLLKVEVGQSPRDRRLAHQILEVFGAETGKRLVLEECAGLPAEKAKCHLIIGTNEGLSTHTEIGVRFRQMLYNQYIQWGDELISAPLIAKLSDSDLSTYCFIAPRPEQLAELAKELASALSSRRQVHWTREKADVSSDLSFSTTVPASGRPALSFNPVIRSVYRRPLPSDLELIRFEVHTEHNGGRELLWSEDIPPFETAGEPWWRNRFVPLTDLAGQNVTFHLTSRFTDNRVGVELTIGFGEVSILN
jgi:hypothetical protein